MGESLDIFDIIQNKTNLQDIDIHNYSPLTLAYIGDGIYELIIRTLVVGKANTSAKNLHKMSSSLVKAATQAEMIKALSEDLTEEEMKVYKRGRNAKSATMAKNATMSDYRSATGFEALMGHLYITKQSDRMIELIQMGLSKIGKDVR
ncbi:MAG: ribonuclease III [Lachnospiraceae bacterium]|nr:ribonuclease III [Lachnospiraceae bacterium]MBQ4068275.1 ribonuclease III [Lachnospiraceae bacterium]